MNRPESATSLGRRPLPRWVLGVILLAELADVIVIILVGQAIGFGRTALLLAVMALLGVWVIARQGSRTVRRVREGGHRQPAASGKDLADGALIVLAGVLFFAPGFIGDVVGLLLLLPGVRALVRRSLGSYLVSHVMVVGPVGPGGPVGSGGPGRPSRSGPDDVIEGEIL